MLVLALAVTGCTDGGDEEPSPTPPVQTTAKPTRLSFGVYGPPDEVTAMQGVADSYNALSDGSDVEVRSWPDHDGLRDAIAKGGKVPDVFMVSRADLAWIQEQGLNQPVEELLDERGVDFGDDYARDALQAFSADNRLQCMPYGISPMVIYYNKELVDFARMRERGLDAPDPEADDPRWTFEQFAAAASFATRPGKHTRGLYVEPTLRGLAPFIYSGGGTLFDNADTPTSLAFSDGDTRAALERTLELLRDPHLNLTEKQLAKASPLKWFKRGRVAMIEGFRSLVPELRQVQGLEFDVMPMPVLDTSATVGDITGLCLSADAASMPDAADFLVHAMSAESVARVARTGYLAPANLEVALSDDFLQPGRQPEHARVFSSSVRSMEIPPPLDSWSELQNAVAGSLDELVSVAVLDDLDALLSQIDEESQTVLDPASATDEGTEGSG
jgi:multiple sugar transport system substrate-binding protein